MSDAFVPVLTVLGSENSRHETKERGGLARTNGSTVGRSVSRDAIGARRPIAESVGRYAKEDGRSRRVAASEAERGSGPRQVENAHGGGGGDSCAVPTLSHDCALRGQRLHRPSERARPAAHVLSKTRSLASQRTNHECAIISESNAHRYATSIHRATIEERRVSGDHRAFL